MDITLIVKWKETSKTGFARQTDTVVRNYFFGLEFFIESYLKMFNASYNVDEMSISVGCGKRSFLVFFERVREFGKKPKKRFSVNGMQIEKLKTLKEYISDMCNRFLNYCVIDENKAKTK